MSTALVERASESELPAAPVRHRRWPRLVLAAAVVVGGAGVTRLATQPRSATNGRLADPGIPLRSTDAASQLALDQRPAAVPVAPTGPPASTPASAVSQFASAEAAGDTDASFALLAQTDRTRFRTPAGWRAAHASLPHLLAATFAPAGGTATFTPALDAVRGLVPARATVRWATVAEDGGFRLDYSGSTITPAYASDATATADITRWAQARAACPVSGPLDGLEYTDGPLGFPALADSLCGAAAVAVEGPRPLAPGADATPFLAEFGPDSTAWARVLRVDAPRPFRVVAAPVGEHWVVVGVLQDGPSTEN